MSSWKDSRNFSQMEVPLHRRSPTFLNKNTSLQIPDKKYRSNIHSATGPGVLRNRPVRLSQLYIELFLRSLCNKSRTFPDLSNCLSEECCLEIY